MYLFPSDFIYKYPVPGHKKLKEKILPQIEESRLLSGKNPIADKWNCKVISSIGKPEKFLETGEVLTEIVWNPVDKMAKDLADNLSRPLSSVSLYNIWWNYYEAGYNQEAHSHFGSIFSGVYFLHLQEPNTLHFFNSSPNPFLSKAVGTENTTEGDVLLFPSHLFHYVKPTTSKRVSIAFNLHAQGLYV